MTTVVSSSDIFGLCRDRMERTSRDTIPIGRGHENDQKYRYRMPAVRCKHESHGNGKKTLLLNLVEIARALHREPAHIAKYLAFSSSTAVDYNAESGRCELRGHVTSEEVQARIQ